MATTARRALRKPVLTDNPDVPRDIGNLADDIDAMMAALITGTTANRATYTAGPPGPKDGDIYWVTDDLTMGAYGTPYKWDSANTQWRIFGPSSPAPQVAITNQQLLQGIASAQRAGRTLSLYDYQGVLGLPQPPGIFGLGSTANLGNGGALTNKGVVPFGVGIDGVAASCAVFAGSTAQALHIDAPGAGPFGIRTGTVLAWHQSCKRGTAQAVVSKKTAASGNFSYAVSVDSTNVAKVMISLDGSSVNVFNLLGKSDVNDGRWHQIGFSFDSSELKIWVDNVCEGSMSVQGAIYSSNSPLTIGADGTDSAVTGTLAHFGRIDEILITPDVLDQDQQRLLYCAKFAHSYGSVPTRLRLQMIRRRRGGPLVTGDFPVTPASLYNFTGGALTDDGSRNTPVVNNNAAVAVAGADGAANGAYLFNGTNQSLTATDTGLPVGSTARTLMCWIKTNGGHSGATGIVSYGTNDGVMLFDSGGFISCFDGSTNLQAPHPMDDGNLHHVAAVWDLAAADGAKTKLFFDGRCVAISSAFNTITAAIGAGGLKIGTNTNAPKFFKGLIDGVAIISAALTPFQIYSIYAKGSNPLGASVKNSGDHIEYQDINFLLGIFDTIEPQHIVNLEVAA